MNINVLMGAVGEFIKPDLTRLKDPQLPETSYTGDMPPNIYYRNVEYIFIRCESGLNILGFVPDISGTTGKLRVVLGVVQVVVFLPQGAFHWVRANFETDKGKKEYYTIYANYEFNLVQHGIGNFIRGRSLRASRPPAMRAASSI